MLKNMTLYTLVILTTIACATTSNITDKYLWLEEVESPRSLEFAKLENEKTLSALQKSPDYKNFEAELRAITYAEDRIPWAYPSKGLWYNLWKDQKNTHGVWRRTTFNEYKKAKPQWEVLLDLDKLSTKENENWVWHGSKCLAPLYEKCLIFLSRGGKDAHVVREYDLKTKQFVKNGFEIPEAKTGVNWIDQDSLYVTTDTGPDSLSDAGYPRTIRLLKRGQKLADSQIVFEVEKNDKSTASYIEHTQEKDYTFFTRSMSFYRSEQWYVEGGKKTIVPMPKNASFYGYFKGYLLFELKSELQTAHKTFKTNSLVALPLNKLNDSELNSLEVIFESTDKKFLNNLSITKNYILLDVIDNIQGKIEKVTFNGPSKWKIESLPMGNNGVVSIYSSEYESDMATVSYTDFMTPYSVSIADINTPVVKFSNVKTSPARFNGKDFISEQKFATSKDGTSIPYFIIHNKNMKLNGANPTLLYGYGGFLVSQQPFYLSSIGKMWMERGGVFVLANIRGGGEFGHDWHQAAVKENHQVVFDDFIAIAEDLIKNNITSPPHLGIQGGSNGGLLVGGIFIQRPDLFNAVVCEVPLLDMLRYHKLLAGSSWMDEYGNPDDPKMREVILKYSPYQNVKAGVKYPEVFFTTSTKDDRVHPAHSRKMVAKMREQGHPLFYYENIDGGHAGVANFEQAILKGALQYTYLWNKLK